MLIDKSVSSFVYGEKYNHVFFYNFLWSTVQIDLTDSQECFMTGGGLPGIYVMDQMHFHWASEHTINGERYGYLNT